MIFSADPRHRFRIGWPRDINAMAAYRILRGWITLFLAGYFLSGLLTLLLPRQEVFPVYSWFLFPLAPGRETRYALRLQQVRGQSLDPPLLYQDAGDFVADPHSVTVDELVQQLGRAEQAGRWEESRRIRLLLEKDHLPRPCRYELVTITFDPLVRWRTGQCEIKPLAPDAPATGAP